MRALLALVVLLIFSAPAWAKEEGVRADGTCAPSDVLYNCSPPQLAELDQLFSVTPGQALDRPGPDVVRVMLSDQNGAPRLRVDAQRVGADGVQFTVFRGRLFWQSGGMRPFRVFKRSKGWTQFAALARAISASSPDTLLLSQTADGETLCVDPDGFYLQTRASGRRVVRFRNDCDEDWLMEQVWAALDQVVAAFPGCSLVEPNRFRRADYHLSACTVMAGADPAAEAAVLERLTDPALDPGSGAALRPMFFPNAQVRWADEQYSGQEAAERLFKTRVLESESVWPDFGEIRGSRSAVVVVKGSLWREGDGGVRYATPFSLSWRQDEAGVWRIFYWWSGPERRP